MQKALISIALYNAAPNFGNGWTSKDLGRVGGTYKKQDLF